ncbi:putative quinol monooxygenase [Ruegeria arenilitoris]|uniref:putative quinol monooxygenase n=1 Tax=Ruegeria arenilitoris TaxID=1173585 RepID=UPI00147B64BD|nr:putative quinol monooxygenase [Ruegeria arenilitoris]
MLIVTGVVEVDPDGIENAKAAVKEMVSETVKEPGCILYEFSQILGQDNRFRVYEEWQDQAALDEHFATQHMQNFRKALSEVGVISREIYRVVGGEKLPL